MSNKSCSGEYGWEDGACDGLGSVRMLLRDALVDGTDLFRVCVLDRLRRRRGEGRKRLVVGVTVCGGMPAWITIGHMLTDIVAVPGNIPRGLFQDLTKASSHQFVIFDCEGQVRSVCRLLREKDVPQSLYHLLLCLANSAWSSIGGCTVSDHQRVSMALIGQLTYVPFSR